MRNNYVVYAHYTSDTNELFYIGEGTLKRAYSKFNRNRYWNFKVIKHNGFIVKILYCNLTKFESELIETNLIKIHKEQGVKLVNFSIGPAFKNHWLLNAPKECHPMYGKKRPDVSIRITEWNKLHSGEKSPSYGLKRPDLVKRNKLGLNRKKGKKVICVETGEIYNTIKDAKTKFPSNHYARNIKNGWKIGGFTWKYY